MPVSLPQAFLDHPLAHRALHDVDDGRPENSRAAIQAAMEQGFGIEIDVQLSSDEQAMVFHDYGLERLTGDKGPVRKRASDTLKSIPLKGGREGIPDLSDVLALVDGHVPLLVEIKDQDGAMGPNVGALESAVAEVVRGYAGPLALMSFNPHAMRHMARLCPDLARGLVTSAYDPAQWPLTESVCDHLRDIPDFDAVDASFISHEAADLDRPRVKELRAAGVPVLCWTIRSQAEEAQARQLADNVTFEGYLPTADR